MFSNLVPATNHHHVYWSEKYNSDRIIKQAGFYQPKYYTEFTSRIMTSISNPLAALCLEVEVSKIPNTISIPFFKKISYYCLSITITILNFIWRFSVQRSQSANIKIDLTCHHHSTLTTITEIIKTGNSQFSVYRLIIQPFLPGQGFDCSLW